MLSRIVLAIAVLCSSLAGPVRAELQVFRATFSLIGLTLPPPTATAIGVATVNGSGGGSHLATLDLPGGLFSIHTTVPVTVTGLPLTRVEIDATLGAGSFDIGSGGTLSGTLPAAGKAHLCVSSCALAFNVPLSVGGTRGVGIGGAAISASLSAFGTLALLGKPWGTGVAEVQTPGGSIALTGFAHGPLSATSSTAEPQGVVQLVTPVRVGTIIDSSPEQVLPLFGLLEVKLLPEPGAFAMLVAGGALLTLVGMQRMRR